MASASPWAALFFVALVSFGAFFVVNLFLAVVFEEFIWTQSVEPKPSVVERRNLVEQVLRKLPFYRALNLVERRRLADALVEESYEEDAVVVAVRPWDSNPRSLHCPSLRDARLNPACSQEGDDADAMYIIKQGHARVTKLPPRLRGTATAPATADDAATADAERGSEPVRETVLNHLHPGAFFGEAAMIDPDGPRVATVTAMSHLVVLRLERDVCLELLGAPSIADHPAPPARTPFTAHR